MTATIAPTKKPLKTPGARLAEKWRRAGFVASRTVKGVAFLRCPHCTPFINQAGRPEHAPDCPCLRRNGT